MEQTANWVKIEDDALCVCVSTRHESLRPAESLI